jgi:hypothetical protein
MINEYLTDKKTIIVERFMEFFIDFAKVLEETNINQLKEIKNSHRSQLIKYYFLKILMLTRTSIMLIF